MNRGELPQRAKETQCGCVLTTSHVALFHRGNQRTLDFLGSSRNLVWEKKQKRIQEEMDKIMTMKRSRGGDE